MRWLLLFALLPLATSAQTTSQKNPGSAQLYSVVVPGGGQLYSGETVKGGVILVGTVGGLAAAATALPKLQADGRSRDYYTTHGTTLGVGLGVAGALWLYGVLDAPHAARRANERRAQFTALPTPQGAQIRLTVPL